MNLTLSGNEAIEAQELTEAEVNHLRRLLAWLRCEYMLDEDMQRGYLKGATALVAHGFSTSRQASAIVEEKVAHINHVPAYVRQAVKMLTEAVRKHDSASGIIEGANHDN